MYFSLAHALPVRPRRWLNKKTANYSTVDDPDL